MSARAKEPTQPPKPAAPRAKSVTQKGRAPASDEAKTSIYESGNFAREASTPIKAISMKTPGLAKVERSEPIERVQPRVKLRAISDVSPGQRPPQNLGYLAPPRDPVEVRARRVHDLVLWGSVAVIVGSVVALIIWFVAR